MLGSSGDEEAVPGQPELGARAGAWLALSFLHSLLEGSGPSGCFLLC